MLRFSMVCALLLGAAACGPPPAACNADQDCTACVNDTGCAWCFETNECMATQAVCPGDRALTEDQCTDPEASLLMDAGLR